jgi:hypothetical protein
MPEEFAKSTLLECDPHFKAKLAAKASTASQQITAQLRADEERLRVQIAAISYYDELKAAIAQHKAKG